MREIKFRAFDPVEKIMVFADVAETDEMNEWVTWELPIDSPINTGIRFDVMQFIDKKDADGIDVYEGDVIQYWELYECHSNAVDYFDVEPQNNFSVDEVFFELKTGVVELVDGAFKVNGTYIFDIAEVN